MSSIYIQVTPEWGSMRKQVVLEMVTLSKKLGIEVRCTFNDTKWYAYPDGSTKFYECPAQIPKADT